VAECFVLYLCLNLATFQLHPAAGAVHRLHIAPAVSTAAGGSDLL